MTDLHERFAVAEHIRAPDLWEEIQWRTISGPPVRVEQPRPARRVVTILVAFVIFAPVVFFLGKAFHASVEEPLAPTPTSSPNAPAPAPLHVGGELPAMFPATLAIPGGARRVASRACCGYVQVWFRTTLASRDVESFYRDALRQDGWTISGHETTKRGGWRYYANQAAGRTAIVVGRSPGTSPGAGSDAFHGTWNLYIIVYG
jgi:hypothetical protein